MDIQRMLRQFRPMKHYIIAAACVFVLGIILGYTDSGAYQSLLQAQIDQLQGMADIIKQSDHQQLSLFSHILLNNLLASILSILLGLFFGIFPLYFLVSNGLLLGFVATDRSGGQTFLYFLKGIVPHGIFEIPAFILACALGLRLGFLMLESIGGLFNEERRLRFQINFRSYIKLLATGIIMVIVLMLLAAVIESTVTYALMN